MARRNQAPGSGEGGDSSNLEKDVALDAADIYLGERKAAGNMPDDASRLSIGAQKAWAIGQMNKESAAAPSRSEAVTPVPAAAERVSEESEYGRAMKPLFEKRQSLIDEIASLKKLGDAPEARERTASLASELTHLNGEITRTQHSFLIKGTERSADQESSRETPEKTAERIMPDEIKINVGAPRRVPNPQEGITQNQTAVERVLQPVSGGSEGEKPLAETPSARPDPDEEAYLRNVRPELREVYGRIAAVRHELEKGTSKERGAELKKQLDALLKEATEIDGGIRSRGVVGTKAAPSEVSAPVESSVESISAAKEIPVPANQSPAEILTPTFANGSSDKDGKWLSQKTFESSHDSSNFADTYVSEGDALMKAGLRVRREVEEARKVRRARKETGEEVGAPIVPISESKPQINKLSDAEVQRLKELINNPMRDILGQRELVDLSARAKANGISVDDLRKKENSPTASENLPVAPIPVQPEAQPAKPESRALSSSETVDQERRSIEAELEALEKENYPDKKRVAELQARLGELDKKAPQASADDRRREIERRLGEIEGLKRNGGIAPEAAREEKEKLEAELGKLDKRSGEIRESKTPDEIESKLQAKTKELEDVEAEIRRWSGVTARLGNNAPEREVLEKRKREILAEIGDLRIARSGAQLEGSRSARIAVFGAYLKLKRDKSANPEELKKLAEAAEASDKDHRRALGNHVTALVAKKMEELIGDPESGEKIKKYKSELVYEFLINEQSRLAERQADIYPPKERGFLMKALGGYARLPRWARTAISGSIAVAIAAGTGGLSAGGLVGVFGLSVARSYLGAGASLGIRGLGEAVWQATVGRRLREAESELKERAGNLEPGKLDELFKDMAAAYERRAVSEKRKRILLTGVQIAGSAAVGWGLHHAAEHLLSGPTATSASGGPKVLPGEKPAVTPPFTPEHPAVTTGPISGPLELPNYFGDKIQNFSTITEHGSQASVEGVLHAQLAAFPKEFGAPAEVIKGGPEAIRHWSDTQADLIARAHGWVNYDDHGRVISETYIRSGAPGHEVRLELVPKVENGHYVAPDVKEINTAGQTYIHTPTVGGSNPIEHAADQGSMGASSPDAPTGGPIGATHEPVAGAVPALQNNPLDYAHMKQPDLLRTLQDEEPALNRLPGGQNLDKDAKDMIGVLSHPASEAQVDSARKLLEDMHKFLESGGAPGSAVGHAAEHIITSNIPGAETIDLDKANQADLLKTLQTMVSYLSQNPSGHGNISALQSQAKDVIGALSQPVDFSITDPAILSNARSLIVTIHDLFGKK